MYIYLSTPKFHGEYTQVKILNNEVEDLRGKQKQLRINNGHNQTRDEIFSAKNNLKELKVHNNIKLKITTEVMEKINEYLQIAGGYQRRMNNQCEPQNLL